MKETSSRRSTVDLMATVICACLYAIGSYLTAYIPSPWGFGQFRPAVVIPSFFAVTFGPMPAAVGAALGTLIADSTKHGYLYPGSLLAAVPGNFVGFYMLGFITKKGFSWSRFILAANTALTVGNFIVAFLYICLFKVIYLGQLANLPIHGLAVLIFGLTLWWFVTMLPFVLLITPVLIRAASTAFPSTVPSHVRSYVLKRAVPERTFSTALLVPGLIMVLLGLANTYTTVGSQMATYFGEVTASLVGWMLYVSGMTLSVLGVSLALKNKRWRTGS